MYKYYQVNERSPWVAISNDKSTEAKVRSQNGTRLTILSLSETLNEDDDNRNEIKYRGPFYVDIDDKQDLQQAIASTNELVDKLLALQIPESSILVCASGSKGFHIIVPAKCFYNGRKLKNLPAVYKELALDLYVPGMDMGVYSAGKGRCWRLPNTQKATGEYKVPVSLTDLRELTEESYRELVKREGPEQTIPDDAYESTPCATLFKQAQGRAQRAGRIVNNPVPEESLTQFKESFPNCVESIRAKARPNTVSFNALVLQVCIFLSRAGVESGLAQSLLNKVADNEDSNTYNTVRKRVVHLEGELHYVNKTPSYKFSCGGMRSVVAGNPCDGCILNTGNKSSAEDCVEIDGLEVRMEEGRYLRMMPKSDKYLSNFTITPVSVLNVPQAGHVNNLKCIGHTVLLNVLGADKPITMDMSAEDWIGSNTLKKTLASVCPTTSFTGTDMDVQIIKELVLTDIGEEVSEITLVNGVGVHVHEHDGVQIPCYLESNLVKSVNKARVYDTHRLKNNVSSMAPPEIWDIMDNPTKLQSGISKAAESLSLLTQMNHPHVMGLLLGWFAASHMKSHVMSTYKSFPLLNLWGGSGTGKTTTVQCLMWLTGSGHLDNCMTDASLSTPYAVSTMVSSSVSIARSLEEVNKHRIDRNKWNTLMEILKASYNNLSVKKGALRGSNIELDDVQLTAPVIFSGEQAATEQAIVQRALQIQLISRDEGHRKAFYALRPKLKNLRVIAAALISWALDTDPATIEDLIEQHGTEVDERLPERSRFGYMVALAGLDVMESIVDELEMGEECAEHIARIKLATINYTKNMRTVILSDANRTEADQVMGAIASIAFASKTDPSGKESIVGGKHFSTTATALYMNLDTCHTQYKRYCRAMGERPLIRDVNQFKQLLASEPYYIGMERNPTQLLVPEAVILDFDKMASKQIRVELFPRAGCG